MTELITERLILRQFHSDDLDAYATICGDLQVMRYIGYGQPLTRQESWRNMAMLLGHWVLKGYGLFALEERASGQLIGRAGVFSPDGWPGDEIGWLLAKEYWGKGYGLEAATAVREWAFDELKLDSMISIIHPENERSIALAERLGETLEKKITFQGVQALCYRLERNQYQ
jgi:RimJ/RimL family protein N-acetyltransferase